MEQEATRWSSPRRHEPELGLPLRGDKSSRFGAPWSVGANTLTHPRRQAVASEPLALLSRWVSLSEMPVSVCSASGTAQQKLVGSALPCSVDCYTISKLSKIPFHRSSKYRVHSRG